jgi:hypothetical protein
MGADNGWKSRDTAQNIADEVRVCVADSRYPELFNLWQASHFHQF